MSKKILIVGASGLVGGEILENLKTTNNELILLSRKKLLCEYNVNQIVIDFEDIDFLLQTTYGAQSLRWTLCGILLRDIHGRAIWE